MLRMLISGLFVLVVSAALAAAAPILDGDIGAGEYTVNIPDTYVASPFLDETGMDYSNTGLDIDSVHLDADASKLYLGVSTKDTFMPAGSPASYTGQTALSVAFYDTDPMASPPASPLWYANVILSASDVVEQAVLVQYPSGGPKVTIDLVKGLRTIGGGLPTYDSSILGKFACLANQGLEITLDMTLLVVDPTTAPFFTMQLDDLGGWDDDQMIDQIPEPATVGLLAVGAVFVLRRRRHT